MARKKSKTPGKNEGTVPIMINLHPKVAAEIRAMGADVGILRKTFIEEKITQLAIENNPDLRIELL